MKGGLFFRDKGVISWGLRFRDVGLQGLWGFGGSRVSGSSLTP